VHYSPTNIIETNTKGHDENFDDEYNQMKKVVEVYGKCPGNYLSSSFPFILMNTTDMISMRTFTIFLKTLIYLIDLLCPKKRNIELDRIECDLDKLDFQLIRAYFQMWGIDILLCLQSEYNENNLSSHYILFDLQNESNVLYFR